MNAAYAFTVDPARSCIRLRMGGFFTPADMPGLLAARSGAHAQLLCLPHEHITLIDLRDMKIQAQEMVEAFAGMLSNAGFHGRRLAVVVSPGLLRTQVRRIIQEHAGVQIFESLRMAEAWIFSPAFNLPIQHLVGQEALRTGT